MRIKSAKKLHVAVLIFLLIAALGAWAFSAYRNFKYSKIEAPEETQIQRIIETTRFINKNTNQGVIEKSLELNRTSHSPPPLPSKLNISLTFFPQAPFGDWGEPYQEACEEASVILVANELKGLNLTREQFDKEIHKVVAWENKEYGDYQHTSVEQTVRFAEEIYGLKTKVHKNPTFEDIQKIISQGNFIVAPFAGKSLKNPYFTNGGPKYHMMIVKGFDADKNQIVTHDVGTRRGDNYVYSWDVINSSIHDWHDEDINKGEKLIIELWND